LYSDSERPDQISTTPYKPRHNYSIARSLSARDLTTPKSGGMPILDLYLALIDRLEHIYVSIKCKHKLEILNENCTTGLTGGGKCEEMNDTESYPQIPNKIGTCVAVSLFTILLSSIMIKTQESKINCSYIACGIIDDDIKPCIENMFNTIDIQSNHSNGLYIFIINNMQNGDMNAYKGPSIGSQINTALNKLKGKNNEIQIVIFSNEKCILANILGESFTLLSQSFNGKYTYHNYIIPILPGPMPIATTLNETYIRCGVEVKQNTIIKRILYRISISKKIKIYSHEMNTCTVVSQHPALSQTLSSSDIIDKTFMLMAFSSNTNFLYDALNCILVRMMCRRLALYGCINQDIFLGKMFDYISFLKNHVYNESLNSSIINADFAMKVYAETEEMQQSLIISNAKYTIQGIALVNYNVTFGGHMMSIIKMKDGAWYSHETTPNEIVNLFTMNDLITIWGTRLNFNVHKGSRMAIYKRDLQTAGGSSRLRKYKILFAKASGKYIMYKKNKVMLKDIRGKYRYVVGDKSKITLLKM